MVTRYMDLGMRSVCGQPVKAGAAFVTIGATEWADPSRPKSEKFVPVEEDIHGWSPFVFAHPACYVAKRGLDTLLELIDESHRSMRARYNHP